MLYLKVPSQQSEEFERVKDLLNIFSGEVPVKILFADSKQVVMAPRSLYALEHPTLVTELTRVLGEGAVVFK